MTITSKVRTQLFDSDGKRVVLLDPRPSAAARAELTDAESSSGFHYRQTGYAAAVVTPAMTHGLPWTAEEHARFILGLEQYPSGPWKLVAAIVGSRDARQTMSHAQKYRMTIQRRKQKKERQQQLKPQRQRLTAPATAATSSTSAIRSGGGSRVGTEIAISTAVFASPLLEVSAGLTIGSEAVFTTSNVAGDKFDQSASARMSPLPFNATPMDEMSAELQEFLSSSGSGGGATAFGPSFGSHVV